MSQPTIEGGIRYGYLDAISCSSTTDCVAVGPFDPDQGIPDTTLVETLIDGVWVQNPSENIGTQFNPPLDVSCSGSFCLGVGWFTPANGHTYPMVMGEGVTNSITHLTLDLELSTISSSYPMAFEATVTSPGGVPTGTVTFRTGSTSLCTSQALWNGEGSCVAETPVGRDVITATYSGDAYFDPSSATGVLTVTPATPPTPPAPPVTSAPTSLSDIVGMAALPNGSGYWLASASGGVSALGSAVSYGSMAGHALNAPIAHIVATPDGRGYWLVAADGGVFSFGDAPFYGSMGGKPLNAPVVDLTPTPDGKGYWLVASDGGVFAFGDAAFHGSMGGKHLNAPVVGIADDPSTGGYWEVASDGGIFAFDAPFVGSAGNLELSRPVNGMTATADGRGYWFVASDGGVFAYGDARFLGSTGGTHLNAPVVGMASDPATGGYWLVASDGGVFSFGAPFYGG